MLVNEPSLARLQSIHRQMGLPEPFVYCHLEDGAIVGVIEGWIQDGVCAVDHLIVLPSKHRLSTLLRMSREATRLLHQRGLDVVIKIGHEDGALRTGLHAWAKRCGFTEYHFDGAFHWLVNRKELPSDG